jgi:hypothetical protein
MNRYGQPHKKLTIWLGSDDGEKGGMDGYGYDVHREDAMVSIEYVRELNENSEELQVFILPDLFPKIRKIMDAIEKRPAKKKTDWSEKKE